MSETLVLDKTWRPVERVSWQRAVHWIFSGRAEVVESYEDRPLRSGGGTVWAMPSIVRLVARVVKFFHRGVKFNRQNVYRRDRGTCQYCLSKVKSDDFTYDHVIPLSRGGKTRWENIVCSCLRCNQRKRDRTPQEAGMQLFAQPEKPKSLPGGGMAWAEHMPESWKDWMASNSFWNEALT